MSTSKQPGKQRKALYTAKLHKKQKLLRATLSDELSVSGVTKKKASGMERFYPLHPSNLMIIKFDLKDERRRKTLERQE
jgi:large subunit ribosomal protein L24